ncbi:hypothetical protein [Sphingobium agri]|uniref:hypothetical protein n=1 Tax=Sphingobium TaxID=165695 RepID=UPI001FF62AFA|nr:hypothetical protein [Sphingobium agri]
MDKRLPIERERKRQPPEIGDEKNAFVRRSARRKTFRQPSPVEIGVGLMAMLRQNAVIAQKLDVKGIFEIDRPKFFDALRAENLKRVLP